MRRFRGLFLRGQPLALVALIAILALRIHDPVFLQVLRMRDFDLIQELFPRTTDGAQQNVVVVDIDDESLLALGQWPWPRTIVGDLIARLDLLGAEVIGIDILFAEADRMSPAVAARTFAGLSSEMRNALVGLPGNDEGLAAVLRHSKVVLGIAAKERKLDTTPVVNRAPLARLGGNPLPFVMKYPSIVGPIDVLEKAAAGWGMVSFQPEWDGVVRRLPLVIAVGNELYPSLTFEMLRLMTGESVAIRTVGNGIEGLTVGPYHIPTDRRGRIWVNFAKHDRGLYVSAKDVLNGTVDRTRIKGRMVLIGTSATGLGDIKATPVDAAIPGVEIHAQILQTVIKGNYLLHPDWATGAELFLVAATGLLVIILLPKANARMTLLVLLGVGGLIAGGTIYLFVDRSTMIDGSLALITSALLYTGLAYENYRREEALRQQIRGAFSQYMSPTLVEHLANDPTRLKLGGETRNMSFLFCDIRGFTPLSERYRNDPESLTRLLNRFMTPMSSAIVAHNGTIDKYIGDCIMAFWNAPLPDDYHPRNACFAALAMLGELTTLNSALAAEGMEPLIVGIGINTGDCIVGNVGSDMRFDYSVIGDCVNVASRLESLSKSYGVQIVIGNTTRKAVKDFAILELDVIAVKGKEHASRVFTILGGPEMREDEDYQQLLSHHNRMLAVYRSADWQAARDYIRACRNVRIATRLAPLYDLYESRIAMFEREPSPSGWNEAHVTKVE